MSVDLTVAQMWDLEVDPPSGRVIVMRVAFFEHLLCASAKCVSIS